MTSRDIYIAMEGIDPRFILDAAPDKEAKPKPRGLWMRWSAVAACACLLLGVTLSVPWIMKGVEPTVTFPHDTGTNDPLTEETDPPIEAPLPLLNATVSPEKLTGSSLSFVVGSSTSTDFGVSAAPPAFEFDFLAYVVKAKAVEVLPDTYYELNVSSTVRPTAYRLIRMQTLESIRGDAMPEEFLYLMRADLVTDLTVYDSLIISMSQHGVENYVLRNGDKQVMEAFPLKLFRDPEDQPELGNMIAFTDGIFDESLWQNESWLFGYQFARHDLDDPGDYLVVYRGCTEEYTVGCILADIEEWEAHMESHGWGYSIPSVCALDFKTEEAKAALAYVQPFENGIFSQQFGGQGSVVFRRYINGCQTEETITIHLTTEEVTYSEVRYTQEELAGIGDVAGQLVGLAEVYANEIPVPLHVDPEGKELRCLNLYGWYAKAEDKIYGVIKTTWIYLEEFFANGYSYPFYNAYYDDSYLLYDPETAAWSAISRDDIAALLGTRNVYQGSYGEGEELPMC